MIEAKPEWLKIRYRATEGMAEIRRINRELNLHTVCDSAHCPNIGECWQNRCATYMILGDRCTRHCKFCSVRHGAPRGPDPGEPSRVAKAISLSGLNYVVITSVTRDDLVDGGAAIFKETLLEIRKENPGCRVELLIPDLGGDMSALQTILVGRPEVLGHNIEVVRSLQGMARDGKASYERSIKVLARSKEIDPSIFTKSSLMLGLGETDQEMVECLEDLRNADVDILTLGQYLRSGPDNLAVSKYYTNEEFAKMRQIALDMGFRSVMAGPFVRSSYKAKEAYDSLRGDPKC